MDTIFVRITPHSNQFWDPTNKKLKMLVGKGVFEVENTAEIQKGLANSALLKSSKEEFDKQNAIPEEVQKGEVDKTPEAPKGEVDKTPEAPKEEVDKTLATPKVDGKKPATKTSTTKK